MMPPLAFLAPGPLAPALTAVDVRDRDVRTDPTPEDTRDAV
ncbi:MULTISPECIES: hypothetical protein [unclassified Streptomyces]